jgi:hypothetical protein
MHKYIRNRNHPWWFNQKTEGREIMIKQFFKEITDEETITRIWKTAVEKFTGRVIAIAGCIGYIACFCFYQSIPMDIFVMVAYIYLLYSTWQKTKQAIIEEEEKKHE